MSDNGRNTGIQQRFRRERMEADDATVVAAPPGGHDEMLETAVSGLVSVLELRDAHAGGHGDAVLELAINVGRALELNDEELSDLTYAARLHDVGKLAIDDAILHKPGALSLEEWAVVREHPAAGATVMASIPGLEPAARMVCGHHERWDGRGYPDALAHEAIPLGARVLAVCDAYCAMIEQRPYRTPLTPQEALAELRAGAGSHFDPRVVDAFVNAVGRGDIQIEEQVRGAA